MKPSETPAIFVSLCHHFSRHLVYLDVRDVAEKVSDRFHASRTAGASWDAWLVRNVFHVCDGRFRCRTMYFATDACEIVIPSLTSSPMRSTVISGGGYVARIFGCLHYFPSRALMK